MVRLLSIFIIKSSALFLHKILFFSCVNVMCKMQDDSKKKKVKEKPDSVLVIEPNREMQRLIRTMLLAYDIREVRTFFDSEKAANSMVSDPPDMVLLDWEVAPFNGEGFLKLFRNKKMYPVCLIPIIVMLSEAKKNWVECAMKLGAHAIIAKPMAPNALFERMKWALSGERELILDGNSYIITGVDERLAIEEKRKKQMDSAREYQASQFAEMLSIQNDIDKILGTSI